MKQNKGFTLIELLAVIVILAIIALITVPVVMNLINNARKGAAESSSYGVIEAADIFYASEQMSGDLSSSTMTIECNTSGVCATSDSKELPLKGTHPTGGQITISETGVTVKNLKYGDYYCTSTTDGKVSCDTTPSA